MWCVASSSSTAAYKQDVVRSSPNNNILWQPDTDYMRMREYENVGLQDEIRNAMQTLTDLIENIHVPRRVKMSKKGFFQHTRSG